MKEVLFMFLFYRQRNENTEVNSGPRLHSDAAGIQAQMRGHQSLLLTITSLPFPFSPMAFFFFQEMVQSI